MYDNAADNAFLDLSDLEFDGAIVQQDGGAGADFLCEMAVGDRHTLGVARTLVHVQAEYIAGHQVHRAVADHTGADFDAARVDHDRDMPAYPVADTAQQINACLVFFQRAVREVQASHVHAGLHHRLENIRRIAGGSDRCDDFGAAGFGRML